MIQSLKLDEFVVLKETRLQIWKELITFGLALLGAVLGLLNTWRALNRERVKLRVRFVHAYPANAAQLGGKMYGIEITNLSAFAVTILEAGLNILGSADRCPFIPHVTPDNKPLPRKLDSREQCTLYISQDALRDDVSFRDVYATTACGITKRTKQSGMPRCK